MVFSTRNTKEEKQALVNVQEVNSLWDILKSRYSSFEQLLVWVKYAHDLELQVILKSYEDDIKKDIQVFEKTVKKFAIKAPRPPRKDLNVSFNTEGVNDALITSWLLMMSQEIIEMYLRAIRTANTNDDLRKLYITKVKKDIEYLDNIVKYLKFKGWMEQPPMYPNIPVSTSEQIDCGEAYHLWEHLYYRYGNIELTNIFTAFTHDGDFKALMKMGQKVLLKQIKRLEKECLKFGIILPVQAKMLYENIGDLDLLDDRFLFRQLIEGIQAANVLHAHAVKQCVTNDRLRTLFTDLLISEIELANKMVLYGKMKTWLEIPPLYRAIRG